MPEIETTITEYVKEMRTIQEVLNEYEERGHTLSAGLKLTDGTRELTLEETSGYNNDYALRDKESPGHYIGYESFKYVIIPNLRVSPIKIKVYKILYLLKGWENPKVSAEFYPDEKSFLGSRSGFSCSIIWTQRIKRCSKVVEVDC